MLEKRKEAVKKLYQAYKLIGEVLPLSEEHILSINDGEAIQNLMDFAKQLEKYISDIGSIDGVYFHSDEHLDSNKILEYTNNNVTSPTQRGAVSTVKSKHNRPS
ncbi:hypothetical protein [Nostoc sp.]|uniref:hypothetical protein n=1 Tax=Nostoc sp. TaxID=1180 RepID=UPI002FFC9F05